MVLFCLLQLAAVAALCVQYESEFRPSMSIVVKALSPLLQHKPQPPAAVAPDATAPSDAWLSDRQECKEITISALVCALFYSAFVCMWSDKCHTINDTCGLIHIFTFNRFLFLQTRGFPLYLQCAELSDVLPLLAGRGVLGWPAVLIT